MNNYIIPFKSQAWWLMPIIPALKRLRQEDCHKFKVKLGYIVRPSFKNNNKNHEE